MRLRRGRCARSAAPGGAVRGPRRARRSHAGRALRAPAPAAAPLTGAPGPAAAGPLPAPPCAPRLRGDAAGSSFPRARPGSRGKPPGLPTPATAALRVAAAPAFCFFLWRAEEGAAGMARAEARVPEAERTGAAGPGPGKRALSSSGLVPWPICTWPFSDLRSIQAS